MIRRYTARSRYPRVLQLPDFSGMQVYLVDGEHIRNTVEVDFCLGGTWARWKFIPDGEIWIDVCLSEFDQQATIRHEATEYGWMTKFGLTYEQAHDKANVIERLYRSSK